MNSLRLAFAFLTLLPVSPKEKLDRKYFAQSVKYFSLVGIFLGSLNLLLFNFYQQLGAELFAVIFILLNLIVTGGLHHDGFMDSMDGIAASKGDRKETLVVMKDPRSGAFAVMSISIAFLLQYVLLKNLDLNPGDEIQSLVLFLMPALSRIMMVAVMYFQVKEADTESSLKVFLDAKKPILYLLINLFIMKVFAVAFVLKNGWDYFIARFSDYLFLDMILVFWMLATWFIACYLRYKLRGHNGDSLGATLVIAEIFLIILLVVFY